VKRSFERLPTADELGAYLRGEREQKSLTLAEISKITKVPMQSLRRIEAGKFDELPAEVFVRGFLRSYAQCVGLDPEDVVRRYVDARSGEVETIAIADEARNPDDGDGEIVVIEARPSADGETSAPSRLHATGSFIYGQLFDDRESAPRRGAVTLAVIILVVVATR